MESLEEIDEELDKVDILFVKIDEPQYAKKNKIRHARFPMKRVIGMKADLNVETCVAIMTDLKYSQDWFYSLRWVPPRFFGNRLKSGDASMEHRLLYRAHKVRLALI